jgi:hypothetical protein
MSLVDIERPLHVITARLSTWTPWDFLIALLFGFVIANLKALPGVYHVSRSPRLCALYGEDADLNIFQMRIFNCLQHHIIFNRQRRITATNHGGHVLFQPVIMTSFSPLLEIDYNIHKSNSTFFSDLDVNRSHLVIALFKPALSVSRLGGRLDVALGGTTCIFRKQIKSYQSYEVWSRVLTWDEKWLYVVSHFMVKGRAKPAGITLGTRAGKALYPVSDMTGVVPDAMLASAISRYVFKSGRKTVSPQEVMSDLGLIPEAHMAEVTEQAAQDNGISQPKTEDGLWNYQRIELERQNGMKIAMSFTALDALHGTFSGSSWPALETL